MFLVVNNDTVYYTTPPEVLKILNKNQKSFRRNLSTILQTLTIRRIIKELRTKKLEATLLFVDFTKAFDFTQRKKME